MQTHYPPSADFGLVLERHLDRMGFSMREFARVAKGCPMMVSQIVRGERTPNPDDLARWARVLKVPECETPHFIALGRSARAKGKADSADYIAGIESTLVRVRALHADLAVLIAGVAAHPSMKSRKDELKRLLEEIRSLQTEL